jgi:ubiquinone/menaquinone biosynthesis C-methylase UbiE
MNNLNFGSEINWAGIWERGILDAWSRCLMVKHGSISEAWNHMAAKYDSDLKHSNRAKFVDKIDRHNPETVLDVGAGSGIFALLLAKRAKRVVVVEPSTGMLDILKKKAREYNLTNIECINKKWEDMAIDELIEINNSKYDFVICSHALYYITDLHNSFKKMNDVCKSYVYLLIGGEHNKDTDADSYSKFYERLHKKPMPSYPDYSCLYMVLRELDIHPDIEMLDTHAKRYVENIDELIERWMDYLDLNGEPTEDQRAAIREYLSGKIKEDDGKLYMEWQSRDALIYWKVIKNEEKT